MSDTEDSNEDEVMDEWADALAEAGDTPDASADAEAPASETAGEVEAMMGIQPASLDPLEDTSTVIHDGKEINLDVILDVPVQVSMEIGSTKMNIRNLLQLNQGSVVELDRLAGEPLNVKVNGTLIAHGEVVVVNEKFGIRLTDIISPAERVKKLS